MPAQFLSPIPQPNKFMNFGTGIPDDFIRLFRQLQSGRSASATLRDDICDG